MDTFYCSENNELYHRHQSYSIKLTSLQAMEFTEAIRDNSGWLSFEERKKAFMDQWLLNTVEGANWAIPFDFPKFDANKVLGYLFALGLLPTIAEIVAAMDHLDTPKGGEEAAKRVARERRRVCLQQLEWLRERNSVKYIDDIKKYMEEEYPDSDK